jgi:hypothetical protein
VPEVGMPNLGFSCFKMSINVSKMTVPNVRDIYENDDLAVHNCVL